MRLPDGQLLVIGESQPVLSEFTFDFYAAKVSLTGVWGREFFTGSSNGDAAFRGATGPEGQLILTGYGWNENAQTSDLMVVITDTAFTEGTTRLYGGPSVDHGFSIRVDSSGYQVAGFTSQGIDSQYLLVSDTWPDAAGMPAKPVKRLFSIFPNPLKPGDTLFVPTELPFSARLLDLSGRQLGAWSQLWGHWQVPASLAAGHYLIYLQAGMQLEVLPLEIRN
jgi:hypothetical protein